MTDMDDLKFKAGEKIEALHIAAKSAAGTSKNKVKDVLDQTLEVIKKIYESFHDIWHNELIEESRATVAAWTRETVNRIRQGAPPLSPVLLYKELQALLKDRVWRRSMAIFGMGVLVGGCVGLAVGLRGAHCIPRGPHSRALHALPDRGVMLVEDSLTPGACAGEVLVRVQAFSVCPIDRSVLRGHGAVLRSLLGRNTVTVGRAFAGVVLDVGAGVSDFDLGDEVWGCCGVSCGGAASQLLIVRSTCISKRPRSLSADTAASIPYGCARALQALELVHYDSADGCRNKRVAVCGTDGASVALVQVLSMWGAHVSVLASTKVALSLVDLGAHEIIESENSNHADPWSELEWFSAHSGPFDAVFVCGGVGKPPHPRTVLRSTAPSNALIDLRPKTFITDRLPAPFYFVFAASFYTYRVMRWLLGQGTHVDWLQNKHMLRPSLEHMVKLVDSGIIVPVLDKVYLPQEFEEALAHACSDEALGTTVIRFP